MHLHCRRYVATMKGVCAKPSTIIADGTVQSGVQALFQGIPPAMLQYLDVRIRRTHVLQDALNQLMHRPDELKKPLRVTFISAGVEEEGQDEGGVTKEFFQLLVRQIFNEVISHDGMLLLHWLFVFTDCVCLCIGLFVPLCVFPCIFA